MEKELQLFKHKDFGEVRIMVNKKGEPLFNLNDVCKILEIKNTRNVTARLKDDVHGKYPILDSLGRKQQATFVNEDGLYDVIFDSRKKEAKKFRKWVTSEVLPTIRKTGGYVSNADMMVNTYFGSLPIEQKTLVKGLFVNIEEQQKQIKEQAPKVETYNQFINADGLYNMKNLAQHLGTGRNRLFKLLRAKDILQEGGYYHNTPYQSYVDRGYFKVKTKTTKIGNKPVTHATAKGAEWIAKKLQEWENQKHAFGEPYNLLQ